MTRMRRTWLVMGLLVAMWIGVPVAAMSPPAHGATNLRQAHSSVQSSVAATWVGRESEIEAHLRSANVVSLEDIGTGVTNPQRAHVEPAEPVESFAWKPIRPEFRGGHWESYKSEIAAYELDKLLRMRMVPPAVERRVEGDVGAAIMWLSSVESVKQRGGKVPAGATWGHAIRRMQTFDDLIGNHDRNAGNILIGRSGELILIDHSRAFIEDLNLPWKIQRVDAELWGRIESLSREDLDRVLGPWLGEGAIEAMLGRRARMASEVAALVKKKGRTQVIVE
jgi:hypothetical protein